jgi:hypothetical protein
MRPVFVRASRGPGILTIGGRAIAIRPHRARLSRSIDHPATISILDAVTALSSRSKAGPLVASLGAADAIVFQDFDDIRAGPLGDCFELAPLVVGCLAIVGGDAQVDPDPLHGLAPLDRRWAAAIRNQVVCVHLFDAQSGLDKARFFAPSADMVSA